MSSSLSQNTIKIVDSPSTLLSLVDNITHLPFEPPSLFMDLEGIALGRHGSISIISLFVRPTKTIYLIDVHLLGTTTFTTMNSTNLFSLKTILESPAIPKVIFDIRNDSDALFSLFQIKVDGIRDLQLMELATRSGGAEGKTFVAGLAKCVERDSGVSGAVRAEWQHTKDNLKMGGKYELFNQRPMKLEIIQYCSGDVALLPVLYDVYSARLNQPFWQSQVTIATKDRIKLSQSPTYDSQARMVLGPWTRSDIEDAMEAWNQEILEAWNEEVNANDVFGAHEEYEFDNECDDYWENARDCIGWEEDMEMRGSPY